MFKIAIDNGGGFEYREFNDFDDFLQDNDLDIYSSIFLVKNGSEEELKAVCRWASEILEEPVLVTDSVINSRLKDPLTFIEGINEDWDKDLTIGEEFQVQSISDIVELY